MYSIDESKPRDSCFISKPCLNLVINIKWFLASVSKIMSINRPLIFFKSVSGNRPSTLLCFFCKIRNKNAAEKFSMIEMLHWVVVLGVGKCQEFSLYCEAKPLPLTCYT